MNQQDKSFLATFTTVMAVLVMLAVAIFMISHLVSAIAAKPDDGTRRMATLEQRIAPVGEVAVAGESASSPAGSAETSSAAPQQAAASAAAPSGEAIYTQNCMACHGTGVLGAPKLGSKEQWEPRFTQGLDTLVNHATNGIRAMPPKGGHPNLTEADLKAAIVHMLKGSDIEVAEAVTETATAPATPATAATAAQPAEAAAAPAAAPAAVATGSSTPQSVQEVTLAASEAANAASQAAAAASQAASAASQAAAAASQAAAAVAQAIDMLRSMTEQPPAKSAAPEPTSAPAPEAAPSEAKPSAAPTPAERPATPEATEPATTPEPAAPETAEPAAATPAPATPEAGAATPAEPAAPATESPAAPEQPAAEPAPAPQAAAEPAAPAPAAQTESSPATAPAAEQASANPPATEAATVAEITIPPEVHLALGKQLYNTACVICHQAGVAGAPKLGDKADWAPRIGQGFDVLTMHAIKGYKAMPPKGGRLDTPDREIVSAVGYMLSELK